MTADPFAAAEPPRDHAPQWTGSAATIRQVVVGCGSVELSALLATPAERTPRALIVALHGIGLRAGYFHHPVHAHLSLLDTATQLGYAVLALDRPGYGRSARALPSGLDLFGQAQLIRAALAAWTDTHSVSAGICLVGHSYGGKLALALAALNTATLRPLPIRAIDVNGVGREFAVEPKAIAQLTDRSSWTLHWGPLSLYPPGTFRLAEPLLAEVPELERRQAPQWPALYPQIAGRVTVPVRFTFAEHERWWRHNDQALATLIEPLAASSTSIDRLPGAGHNISLGYAARTYHSRALTFFGTRTAPPAVLHDHVADSSVT